MTTARQKSVRKNRAPRVGTKKPTRRKPLGAPRFGTKAPRRPSQRPNARGSRKPSARLVARRQHNSRKGAFPNPAKRATQKDLRAAYADLHHNRTLYGESNYATSRSLGRVQELERQINEQKAKRAPRRNPYLREAAQAIARKFYVQARRPPVRWRVGQSVEKFGPWSTLAVFPVKADAMQYARLVKRRYPRADVRVSW
jgi:hypothetical protein